MLSIPAHVPLTAYKLLVCNYINKLSIKYGYQTPYELYFESNIILNNLYSLLTVFNDTLINSLIMYCSRFKMFYEGLTNY